MYFSIEIDFIRISCLVLSFTDSPASGTSHTTKEQLRSSLVKLAEALDARYN